MCTSSCILTCASALHLQVGTPSAHSTATGGKYTPDSAINQPALYQVLQQTDAKIGHAAFGSSHGYVVPPRIVPPPSPPTNGAGGGKRGVGSKGGDGGVAMALDPAELEYLDEAALKARYESLRAVEREENAPQDVCDIIEAQERKRKRKLEAPLGDMQ